MALKDQKDLLIAWINGEDIQINMGTGWKDCGKFSSYDTIGVGGPYEYRIKPKELVSTTRIEFESNYGGFHSTYTNKDIDNLRLTWSEDGKTLLKAEVI
jgi:hypothetical protein